LQDNTKEKNIVFGCVNYVTATRPDAAPDVRATHNLL